MAKRGYESQKTGQKVDDLLDKIDNLNVPEWALQESKPSYTAQEVHALPENTSIPRKTSDLVNDRGFITQERDPTVPLWAKQPTKPGYTAQEVGALPSDTPLFSGDYNDLRNKPTIPTVPENVSAFNNDAGYLTVHQDISGKEDKSNKVTSLSVQNTDTQYPSAKAVFDNLSTKQDAINDLASIRSGASAGATAYQKPQAGIPESDLSQGVKDKMNEKEVFVAEYGVTTSQEILEAYNANKSVIVFRDNRLYVLTYATANDIRFQNFTTIRLWQINLVNDVWSTLSSRDLETSNYKAASLNNTTSTVYYPSNKAVADYVAEKDKLVEVEYGVTTYAEVKALWDDGKIPFIIKDYSANLHIKLYCTSHNDYGVAHSNTCFFFSVLTMIANTRLFTFTRLKYNDTWENLGQYYPEVTNSKSTNLEQHKTSDNYYPSTKAVADYVAAESLKVTFRQW